MKESRRDLSQAASADRRSMILLFCFFSLLYGYFFQGGGWNPNSQFDTVRALAEKGTLEITAYAGNTGDIATFHGRVFSNKPPGVALWGAPFYFGVYHLERALGIDPGKFPAINANAHLITWLASGLPSAVLLLFLYSDFRRRGGTIYESLCLTAAFGLGSLAFPYSGILMNHMLAACLLFASWYLVSREILTPVQALGAGLLAGISVLVDSLGAPVVAMFVIYLYLSKKRRALPAYLMGAGIMACVLAGCNYWSFGSPWMGNQAMESAAFKTPGYLFGTLTWPMPIRLYWLTVHPFRGIFSCCPLFVVCLFSLRWPPQIRTIRPENLIPLAVAGYYLLFNMSFNGWTGGWGVGPRYMIPALPFLYSLSLEGYRRWPGVSQVLMILSVVFMCIVTAVAVQIPAPNFGGPPFESPVAECFSELARGNVSATPQGILYRSIDPHPNQQWDSYNLGEVAGLRGLWSLVPPIAAILVFWFLVERTRRDPPETAV